MCELVFVCVRGWVWVWVRSGRVGRADRMGLAISIVAADDIEEKVNSYASLSVYVNCITNQLVNIAYVPIS